MTKRLILAEKADEAKKYALAFEQHRQVNGVWIVSDSEFGQARIVHAQGHLTELDEPQSYSSTWKNWQLNNLPIIPQKFHSHIANGRNQHKLFELIKKEVQNVDEIIIGTDADREGENIAYSILRMIPNGVAKISQRIWQNSTTKKGIRNALKNLKDARETKPFADEALARQKSDWLVGMNMSRLATLKMNESGYRVDGGFPVGRVQTAIVALIVQNDQEIKNFRKKTYWQLELTDRLGNKYRNDHKFENEDEANKALAVLHEQSEVTDYTVEQKAKAAPKLLSLFDASAIAKTNWGYTSDKTLDIIQGLYDRGADKEGWISYPRTSINYITNNEFEYLANLVKQYQDFLNVHFPIAHPEMRKQYVDNAKTKEHTALIPTEVLPNSNDLGEEQANIYRLIALRTILMFAPDCEYEQVKVTLKNDGYAFKAQYNRITNPGYTEFLKEKKKQHTNEEIPSYEINQRIFTEAKVVQCETKPPKRLTEAALVRTVLPKYKIGTAATMASTLKLVKKHGYVKDSKDGFYPTDKGIAIIEFLDGTPFIDPETTSVWETYLKMVGQGKKSGDKFVGSTVTMVKKMIEDYSKRQNITVSSLEKDLSPHSREVISDLGTCPVCRKGKILEVAGEGKNGHYHMYACDNKKCGFYIPGNWGSKQINTNDVMQIILNGKTDSFVYNTKNNKQITTYLTIKNKKIDSIKVNSK